MIQLHMQDADGDLPAKTDRTKKKLPALMNMAAFYGLMKSIVISLLKGEDKLDAKCQ
jgi:hypothetical protein